ncbi:MAG: Scr1 family TA system antitoxin-like transcriptional regulator, partial [Sciscionella sp.]
MTDQARVEYSSWRKAYSNAGGAAQSQADIGERERRATTTSEFAPTMIPGLLQTAGYAREVLALPTGPAAHGATPEAMAAERIKRQDILYQQGRSARFVLGEAALRTRFGSVDTLVAQLDRLVALAGLVTVDLAVVPFA